MTFALYQPVAIHVMVCFDNALVGGGILGEEVGLGKTVEMIGLFLFRSNQCQLLEIGPKSVEISR